MTFEEFTHKVLEKFDISLHVRRMHYTLKFNPRVIQDLEDKDDLDNVVSHSDDFANVYIVESPGVESIEANISNTSWHLDSEYTPLESNRFREAILGSGHTFKNADEFRNAIYQMSLAGRFQYKYKKNSPTHMSVKCSVEDCPWKITAHVRVSSKRGAVVEDVFKTTPEYLPRQICKDFERDHGVQLTYNQAWHLKEKAKERVYGSPHDGMFPLALGVVGSENYEDWYWFLEKLKGILDGQEVFIGDVYLVVDMQQHKCTCLTWQMSRLPCPHVCVVICTLRHDVYDYIDPCFKVSTQHLILLGSVSTITTHNMPKVCEAGTLQDGQGNVFPSLQPLQVRRPPERPRQRRIESQFRHKRAIHCS
ncbi:hypothetical protein CK203_055327 [Vitis vinifera]|uniref:SWIM-type domain-containing protein n=1 Tax=Vitis vinifera TaxID=29760 RepID=A0A438GSV7_VITVI|nr:hypothetical protein CK203_055327 [Vitis vinifera]